MSDWVGYPSRPLHVDQINFANYFLPFCSVVGLSAIAGLIPLSGQHTSTSLEFCFLGQKNESLKSSDTSPGMGFTRLVTMASIILHLSSGTHNAGVPVGRLHDLGPSSSASGSVNARHTLTVLKNKKTNHLSTILLAYFFVFSLYKVLIFKRLVGFSCVRALCVCY